MAAVVNSGRARIRSIACEAFHSFQPKSCYSPSAYTGQRRAYRRLNDNLSELVQQDRLRPVLTDESSSLPLPSRNHRSYKFQKPPRTVLLVKKPEDTRTTKALELVIRHIQSTYPDTKLVIEQNSVAEMKAVGLKALTTIDKSDKSLLGSAIDLIVSIGGDGTILHISSLFDQPGVVPPVLSFSMGSLGFLLPFHIDTHQKALSDVFNGKFSLLDRMRLVCSVHGEDGQDIDRCPNTGWQVMNEVALHRGKYPHLSVVDAFVDNQHLTEAVADGLILATPTGSTAYSLSAGGPIAHPSVNSFLLTPIAPRSLSWRTLLLPSDSEVIMQISKLSRAPSELSMDGREVCVLQPGEYIKVSQSAFPIPCVTRTGGGDDWVADINSLLQFNVGFKNKSLWRHTTS